jgi:hypothetical protein
VKRQNPFFILFYFLDDDMIFLAVVTVDPLARYGPLSFPSAGSLITFGFLLLSRLFPSRWPFFPLFPLLLLL